MLRTIIGFAVLAIVAWIVLKIFFGLLGTVVGLAFTVLTLAVIGYVVYMVLKLIAPGTANRIKDTISGPRERV